MKIAEIPGELDLRRSFVDRFMTSANKATACIVLGTAIGAAGSVVLLDPRVGLAVVSIVAVALAVVVPAALCWMLWFHRRHPPATLDLIFNGHVPDKLP